MDIEEKRKRHRVSAAKWRVAHPEKWRVINARWKSLHPKEYRTINARYRAAHPEVASAYNAKYYVEHKEEAAAYRARYRAAHLVEHCAYQRNREHRQRANGGNFTRSAWEHLKALFGHCCAYCGRRMARLTQDHVVPVSRGGWHFSGNIVPACASCNSRKGAR